MSALKHLGGGAGGGSHGDTQAGGGDDAGPSFVVQLWRHPKALGADGRCIGRTDLLVDPRKAKRLAHRIRAHARRHALPRSVITSPLQRCAAVGRMLAAWGWRHRTDPALLELDFGAWDGRRWNEIPRVEIDAWSADLLHHRPGGGENVAQLLLRVCTWPGADTPLLIGHAGWICAAQWWAHERRTGLPTPITATEWPRAPAHGSRTPLRLPCGPGRHTRNDAS